MGPALIAAAPYLLAASAGISAIGAISGGQQQQAAFNQQAAADRSNADQARVNAAVQLNTAEAEAARTEGTTRRRVATAFNQAGASGVDAASGSPLDVLGDIAAEGALDTQIQRWKGRAGANAQLGQARSFEAQAGFAEQAGSAAATAGYISAGSTLLGGLSNYATIKARK